MPIPGASSVLAAVVASGITGPRWGFEGFLPRTGRERKERVARIAADDRATILFEAPTRLAATLRDLASACGPDRSAAVCRELTKVHEQIARGSLAALSAAVVSGAIPARGEIVIVVAGGAGVGTVAEPTPETLQAARSRVEALVRAGTSRAEAAKQVAKATGHARRDLYRDEPNG